ncbi:HNH endonuclease [Cellulosimicrobium funkei]|uniref:HNH endonuclease n=1 Tax=Cellulosimicrobium funkei TaxID=264251 RepID=UPI00379F85B4
MAAIDDRSSKAMKKLKADQRAKRLPCWLCGQDIDYDAPHDDPESFSYDHAKPWATHPELRLDPGNGRSAHLRCNKARGTRDPRPSLGLLSRVI